MWDRELKICPFCGSQRFSIEGDDIHWVVCKECKCEGPLRESVEAAVKAWNERMNET